jgi:hypothetical protein
MLMAHPSGLRCMQTALSGEVFLGKVNGDAEPDDITT